MADATSHFARDLAAAKKAFVGSLDDLKTKAEAAIDWRAQVRQRPLATVGVAFAAGVAAALLTPASGPGTDSLSSDGKSFVGSALRRYLTGVLVAAAAAKAVEMLRNVIPGFDEHLANQPGGELVQGMRRTDTKGPKFARVVSPVS